MAKWADVNILRLLNGTLNPAAERVTWIVESCQRVIRLHEALSGVSGAVTSAREKEALSNEAGRILEQIGTRLRRYTCLPVVRYLGSGDACFDVQYLFLAASEAAKPECVAVAFVMDHIHAVHRIRRCRRLQCRKWFFAITDRQKYCTGHCRKIDAQQGVEFRRKRAEYMRERYRPTQKERDAKIDAQAMIGTAKPKRKSRRQGNAKS